MKINPVDERTQVLNNMLLASASEVERGACFDAYLAVTPAGPVSRVLRAKRAVVLVHQANIETEVEAVY